MSPQIKFSTAAGRTSDSPISDLMARALSAPDVISLAAGFVDHATLPVEDTAVALSAILGDSIEGRRALQYGTTRGDLKLRHQLVERLVAEGQVPAERFDDAAHRLVVTSGSQQLLYLAAEALIDPGDIVLVESPTYFVYLGLLQRFGTRVIGIETDAGGLSLEALESTLADLDAHGQLDRVKLLYTITEHSNPSGLSLAAERRPRLIELIRRWSRRQQIFILEDAAYRGLTFEGVDPPSLCSLDPEGTLVIHARTFSKTYSPGLKTGYAILPHVLLDPVLALKGNHDFGTCHFVQQLFEQLLATGSYDRHVEALRSRYRIKRDVMLAALEQYLGGIEGVAWTRPHGGLFVWVTVPEGIDMGRDGPLFNRCVDEGVLYVPGALAYAPEPCPAPVNHARLSFGVAGPDGIEEGIRRMSIALAECLDPVH